MAEQSKVYFRQYPGFRFTSGVKISKGADKGKTTDFGVLTGNAQGYVWFKDGVSRQRTLKTSIDVCGKRCAKDEPAKLIQAENGAIILEAEFGDIVLKGRNVRIEATAEDGEVTITSGKHIYLKASITNIKGTTVNCLASHELRLAGQFINMNAGITNEVGQLTDFVRASFLGKLMIGLTRFKEFLE
tara:strand:+ start:10217 stop:10777 length:561 start_codon:yes stop_codon:yes gene_type:complete